MFRPRGTVVEAGGQKVFNAAPPDIGGNPVRDYHLSTVYSTKNSPTTPFQSAHLAQCNYRKTVLMVDCRLLLLILLAVYKSEMTFR